MDGQSLEQRVHLLEARCRRLRIGVLLSGGLLLAAGLTAFGSQADGILRAERFELLDEAGQVRGRLEMDGVTPRLVLESSGKGSACLSAGPTARPPSEGGASEDAMATLTLHGMDAGGRSLWTEIQVTPDANMLFMDGAGPSLLALCGNDGNDEPGAGFHMTAEETGTEPFGHASLWATIEGGGLHLGADDMNLVRVEAEGPRLELLDREEKVLFKAP